jgi:hypothetical protein
MDCPRCLDNKVHGLDRKKMRCADTREYSLNVRSRKYVCRLCGHIEHTSEVMRTTLKKDEKKG